MRRNQNRDLAENTRVQHAQIEMLQAKNEKLRQEKQLLEQDPVYLEKVAREKMGLVRQGEVVYKLTPRVVFAFPVKQIATAVTKWVFE